MTDRNGQLPKASLSAISTPGQLRSDAAASFERLRAAAKADGFNMGTTTVDQAYRPDDRQVYYLERYYDHTWRPGLTVGNGGVRHYAGKTWYRKPGYPTAAEPGTSNHGWGVAVDFQGLGGWAGYQGKPEGRGYAWMRKHAREFGWTNDEGRRINEPWHWDYVPDLDQHKNDGHGRSSTTTVHFDELEGFTMRKLKSTGKDQTLKAGTWTTVRVDDDGNLSLASGAGEFLSIAQLSFSGLPTGAAAQVRFIEIATEGGKSVTKATYPITEIVGTAGQTFGEAVQAGALAKDRRLRVQALVSVPGVKVTSVTANTYL